MNEAVSRWKRAAIHIEGATDSATMTEKMEAWRQVHDALQAGELDSC